MVVARAVPPGPDGAREHNNIIDGPGGMAEKPNANRNPSVRDRAGYSDVVAAPYTVLYASARGIGAGRGGGGVGEGEGDDLAMGTTPAPNRNAREMISSDRPERNEYLLDARYCISPSS